MGRRPKEGGDVIDFKKIEAAIEAAPQGDKVRAAVAAMIPAFFASEPDRCPIGCPFHSRGDFCNLTGKYMIYGCLQADCPARR